MEHIDTRDHRLPFSTVSCRRPVLRARFAALAVGIVGAVVLAAGSPSRARASSTPAMSDALAFARSCELGDATGCNDLGVTYLHGLGVPADTRRAVQAFERSCKDGSPDGCSNLGALYERGVGVAASVSEAARLYEQACDAGGALGCSNLGALYAHGLGVSRDLSEARRLFQQACDGGSAWGCHNLMQLSRRSVVRNSARTP